MATRLALRFSRPARRSAYHPSTVQIAQQRGVTVMTSPLISKDELNTCDDAHDLPQTSNAKPFDQVPGLRPLPIIGTSWGMFPRVGKTPPFCCWVQSPSSTRDKSTSEAWFIGLGDGIPISRMLELQRLRFKRYGYIWRDIVPGMPPIVYTARPEDIEK